jgi:hypothetical protein
MGLNVGYVTFWAQALRPYISLDIVLVRKKNNKDPPLNTIEPFVALVGKKNLPTESRIIRRRCALAADRLYPQFSSAVAK